jgi:UDP-glucuronate 4-epimerase
VKRALVTGAAGFIGSHLVDALLARGWRVVGLDSFDPFYARGVKNRNVSAHRANDAYALVEADLRTADLERVIGGAFDVVVHLAARAGVRPSIADPVGYQEANIGGTQRLLEFARARGIVQFVFASSSSVYGVNPNVPWREDDPVLLPISPYAATKVSSELAGHVYSRLYGIRFIAARLFTVYGPRQRPDLAIHRFARRMLEGRPIPVYGDGSTRRDYTFVADIVQGLLAAVDYTATPYEVINLGNNQTVRLDELIAGLEAALGVKARIDRQPEQPGDVSQTWASIDKARALLNYEPTTSYADGVQTFARWLREEQAVDTR